MAGSSSDAGGMDVASEHIAEDGEDATESIIMKVISFDFGMQQQVLESWRSWMYVERFAQLLHTFSQEYIADVVLGCEVGWWPHRGMQLPNLSCRFMQNYMIALNQNGVTTNLLREPEVTQLAVHLRDALDTQLVLTAV